MSIYTDYIQFNSIQDYLWHNRCKAALQEIKILQKIYILKKLILLREIK